MMDGQTLLTTENNSIQVMTEVLWALSLIQRTNHCKNREDVSILYSVTKDHENEPTEVCILKVFTHQKAPVPNGFQGFKIADFIRGLGSKLLGLLSETTYTLSSECWVQVGYGRFSLVPTTDRLCLTYHDLPAETTASNTNFEFYLKITRENTITNVIHLEERLTQQLLRYQLTDHMVSLSLQIQAEGSEISKSFEQFPRSSMVPIGGILVSKMAKHYISREEMPHRKTVGIQVGEAVNVTNLGDRSLPTRCQIGCLLFDCSQTVRGDVAQSTIQVFLHGCGGTPLASAGDEKTMTHFSRLLGQILTLESLGFKINDEHHQLRGEVSAPDLTFTVSVSKIIPAGKEKIQTPFVLILHFVCPPSFRRNIPDQSLNDTSSNLLKSFIHHLEYNATTLQSHVTQLVSSAAAEVAHPQGRSKKREREESLQRAVPTVVDAITSILCDSTNHIFRRNCLAYAGASNTQEVAQFLTERLTAMTEPLGYIRREDDLKISPGPAEDTLTPSDAQLSDLTEDHLAASSVKDQADLEEVDDLDLLEALEECSSQEAVELPETDDIEEGLLISNMESDLNTTGLGQITEEVIKSLLEEDDLFEEQLLNSDWLNGEE